MAHFMDIQHKVPNFSDLQTLVKQEPPDLEEEYNYLLPANDCVLKYDIKSESNNYDEVKIKVEIDSSIEPEDFSSNQPELVLKSEEFFVKDETDDDFDELQCLICDEICAEKSELLSHIADHGKRFYCDICQKTFPRNDKYISGAHKCIPAEYRRYVCDICHKRYTEKHNLDRHKCIHDQAQVHLCDHCPKRFHNKSSLLNHKHYHKHKSSKPYLCDMCHKRYHQLCHLERHKLTHTGEKPFQCEICHKRFGDNTNLTDHRRCHTDERPYECSICHKWFKTSSNLINHGRVHTDERPYVCNICEKTFRKNSNLTSHKKVHRIDDVIDEFDVNTKNPRRRRNNTKRE